MNIFNKLRSCVIFGGTGFIGTHLSSFLLEQGFSGELILADIQTMTEIRHPRNVRKVFVDVRLPIESTSLPEKPDLIINLAAIHREPGHQPQEYFETNILGARHVCRWAEETGCNKIIFTSSISPYGAAQEPRTEESLPMPKSPYGISKLASEYEHRIWQTRGRIERRLVIVRPGVVFGAGEKGNVTRMIHAVLGNYFAYMGNRTTIKAAIYVRELCQALFWALDKAESSDSGIYLFNGIMRQPPSIEQFVNTILLVSGAKKRVPTLPYSLLYGAAKSLDTVLSPLGIKHPFNPLRVSKLKWSTYVLPSRLIDDGYMFSYTLESALRDWKKKEPLDWGIKKGTDGC